MIDDRWYDPDTGRFINCGTADDLLAGAGTINGLNLFLYALNDGVNAVGNSHSIESAYEMESVILCRVEEARRRRTRRIWGIVLGILAIALMVAVSIVSFGKAIPAAIAGTIGIVGIAFMAVAMAGATWTVVNSIACVMEAFCEHGYNFMRDGLFGGNEQLHTVMAWVGVGMMIVGNVGMAVAKGLKNVGVKQAQGVLNGVGAYGEQGGHHILAKVAFSGHPAYDMKAALTISNATLKSLNPSVAHTAITGKQKILYTAFAKTGKTLTLKSMQAIEIQAMVNAGVPIKFAKKAVKMAAKQIRSWGIEGNLQIPWG